jgi:fumarate reductase (CoM/CoB) subunit B
MRDKNELQQVTNCALCADMCKYSCPTYLAAGNETISPQKIARLIVYEDKGLVEDRRGFSDVMFQSCMCGACKRHCIYSDYDLRKFIQMGRSIAFREDLLPDETKKRVETFMKYGNPQGERQLIQKGSGTVGYFVSCSAYKDEELLKAMDRILSASKEKVQQFGGAEICCGAPLYYAGDIDGFKKIAKKLKREIEARGLDKVITMCPNCLKMMRELYPQIGVKLNVQLAHTSEYLASLLDEGKIKVKKVKGTATYHDPCILANDMDITAPPRQILTALGYKIKEPVYTREHTHCCGAPPGARLGFSKLADQVKSMRLGELRETGVDVYVSSCPSCKAVLSDLAVKDIAELISEQVVRGK